MPTAVSLLLNTSCLTKRLISISFIFHDDDAHQNLSDVFCHQILPDLAVVQIGLYV